MSEVQSRIIAPDEVIRQRIADAEERYAHRLAVARREKAEEWSEHRRKVMAERFAVEQRHRAAGLPFITHPEPPLECPDWFVAGVQVTPEPISHEPATVSESAAMSVAPEAAFAEAAKPSISKRMKQIVKAKS